MEISTRIRVLRRAALVVSISICANSRLMHCPDLLVLQKQGWMQSQERTNQGDGSNLRPARRSRSDALHVGRWWLRCRPSRGITQ